MPCYAASSWIGILLYGDEGKHLFPVSVFGAVWAVMNTKINKKIDAGFISMGLVAAASGAGMVFGESKVLRNIETFGCVLAAANFAVPFAVWGKVKRIVEKGQRTSSWLMVFQTYLIVMVGFWIYAAWKNSSRDIAEN